MNPRERGRRPLRRKAMTAAERQARRRQRLQEAGRRQREEEQQKLVRSATYRLPQGYGQAKSQLQALGHHFEHARKEFGFEEGVFVDGTYLSTIEVIRLAELSRAAAAARRRAPRQEEFRLLGRTWLHGRAASKPR